MKKFIILTLFALSACQPTPKEPCQTQTTEQTLMKSALAGLAIAKGAHIKIDCF